MLVPEIFTLLDTDLLEELIFVLDDLTDVDELTDCDKDFCTLSDTDDVSDTLFWTLSCKLFSDFCTRLDWTLPSALCSTLSATLFADRLADSMTPVAVFSTLDCNDFFVYNIENWFFIWKRERKKLLRKLNFQSV